MTRAYPVEEEIPAVLVPERELEELVVAVRDLVVNARPMTGKPVANFVVDARTFYRLDLASDAFVDSPDLGDALTARDDLRVHADRVSQWVEGGCISLPPVAQIRALAEALK